jgi:hypothetical protein
MKHILKILLFLSVSLAGLAPLHAQWEKIGWEGGGTPTVTAQLDTTLYGTINNTVYKSTDWGKTWTMFHEGLPYNPTYSPTFHIFRDYILTDAYYSSDYSSPFGFYYCKENDKKWSFYKISNLRYPKIFYFSADTIVTCVISAGYYFSTDQGQSWKFNAPDTTYNDIAFESPFIVGSVIFAEYRENITAREAGTDFRSENFGQTWDTIPTPFNEYASYDHQIDRGIPSVILDSIVFQYFKVSLDATSYYGLFRSSDLCNTWEETKFTDTCPNMSGYGHISNVKKIGDKTFLFYYNIFNDGYHGVFISDDLGKSWKKISVLDSALIVYDIWGKENYYILLTYDNVYYHSNQKYFTTDSSFAVLTPLNSSEKGIMDTARTLVAVSGTKLFALLDTSSQHYYDSIMLSTDNGITWEKQLFFGNNKLDIHRWVVDGADIYASGMQKDSLPCLFHTSDNGETWSIAYTFSSKDSIREFFVQNDTIVVIKEKDYFVSIDIGKSWVISSFQKINDSLEIDYRNKILIMRNTYTGAIWSSDDFFDGVQEQVPGYGRSEGLYIFGNRIFVLRGYVQYDSLYFKEVGDTQWMLCKGLPSYQNPPILSFSDEGSILFACANSVSGWTVSFYSLDSGSNWQQLGDNVTNSSDVFIGSDYIFLAGPTELWRGPKPTLPASVASAKSISSISINECYPNPATSEMRISYSVPKRSNVVLSAFDITGKEIAQIASEAHDAGSYETVWDSRALASGSYILKLTACGMSVTKVVEVVK